MIIILSFLKKNNYKGCQLYGFAGGLSGFLSITTLTFMTIERYFMVKNPLNSLKERKFSVLGK